jgi:acetyl-CoA synthetase
VDTWWQTETGAIMVSPLPGITATKPGAAQVPLPGVSVDVVDDDGDIWLLGRVDDVMNVSGHRLSTTEIESALVSHPMVAEAAVVGASDATTGQSPVAFVILRESAGDGGEDIVADLRNHVAHEIGGIAKPRQIMVVAELPKTRSGKIMRRLLRDVAEKREIGDVTTLADSTVMDLIGKGMATATEE